MITLCAAALYLAMPAGASLTCLQQEAVWSDTQFSRVHLRNGNVIDGTLLRETEKNIQLAIQGAGILIIPKSTIVKLEAMKMRSFVDLPKVYVPQKVKTDTIPPPPNPTKMLALAPPEISPSLRGIVAKALGRYINAQSDEERDQAVEELASHRALRPYLASLLTQVNASTTSLIRTVLERSFDPETQPYLKAALDSDSPEVVATAISLLGRSGDAEQAGMLRRFLESPQPGIRAAAISALAFLDDEGSIDAIARQMTSTNDEVRVAAMNAALRLGNHFQRMETVSGAIREGLGAGGPKVVKDLFSVAVRTRRRELWDAIEPFLRDGNIELRRAAADAFRQLAPAPAAVPTLVNRLRQEDDEVVRILLIQTAGTLESTEAVPPLIDILRSGGEVQAKAAARSLQQITKEKFGEEADRWSSWWDQMHGAH